MAVKTLDEIKEEYALEKGYNYWTTLMDDQTNYGLEGIMDEIATRYATEVAKQALQDAAENAIVLFVSKDPILNTPIKA